MIPQHQDDHLHRRSGDSKSRLSIRHETRYRYARDVSLGQHRMVLRPREGHDLTIARFDLRIRPAHAVTWTRDVYGNSIALVDFLATARELVVVAESHIQRSEPFPGCHFHEPFKVSWPADYDPLELPLTSAYRTCVYPEDVAAVTEWLAGSFRADPEDGEGTALALCKLIFESIAYRRRMERGVQSPAETLKLASGSCRDMATLLLEACRIEGIAARFASGYLHGVASVAGRGSTHAWTEIYLPMLGWRGFDPTLGEPVSLRHVVTGVSHHPRGVMPISGTYDGTRADFLELTVQVLTEE